MNKLDTRVQIAVIMLVNKLINKYINNQHILVIVTKLDRYLFKQLIGPFAFFCFIISGILLLNQALGIIDIVTENGQPAYIVFELSFLILPKVLITAISISGFTSHHPVWPHCMAYPCRCRRDGISMAMVPCGPILLPLH